MRAFSLQSVIKKRKNIQYVRGIIKHFLIIFCQSFDQIDKKSTKENCKFTYKHMYNTHIQTNIINTSLHEAKRTQFYLYNN